MFLLVITIPMFLAQCRIVVEPPVIPPVGKGGTLKVTRQGNNTQTWIGKDGRRYTARFISINN